MRWHKIDDPNNLAPRDGTPVIGGFFSLDNTGRYGDVVRCWWQPEFNAFISSCRVMVLAKGYKFADGTQKQLHSPVIEPITHWMPFEIPKEDTNG